MYELIGMLGSPYSLKVRGVMRYRHVPHIWTMLFPPMSERRFSVRPLLLPIVRYPDGSEHIDSTAICEDLECWRPGSRSLYPQEPQARFASFLIEDFADEWLTKAMFHYRWNYAEDVSYCSRWLASDIFPQSGSRHIGEIAALLAERQISRLAIVGCDRANAGVIESGLMDFLLILGRHLERCPFLFGTRPSIADFAIYGQLSQLVTDPVPARLIREKAQTVFDWVRRIDDVSGLEGGWRLETLQSESVRSLLTLISEEYLPFLVANHQALLSGSSLVSVSLRGRRFEQPPFRYQKKCLDRLRALYGSLGLTGNSLFAQSGCAAALA